MPVRVAFFSPGLACGAADDRSGRKPARGKNARWQPTDPAAQLPTTDPAGLCTLEGPVAETLTGAPAARPISSRPGRKAARGFRRQLEHIIGRRRTLRDEGHPAVPAPLEGNPQRRCHDELRRQGPARAGTVLPLAGQQDLAELTLKLKPQSMVAGRVVDGNAGPAAKARVTLQSLRDTQGRRQLRNTGGGASANDYGECRIFNAAPE